MLIGCVPAPQAEGAAKERGRLLGDACGGTSRAPAYRGSVEAGTWTSVAAGSCGGGAVARLALGTKLPLESTSRIWGGKRSAHADMQACGQARARAQALAGGTVG